MVFKIKRMVTELCDKEVVAETIVEIVIPMVHDPNIWDVLIEMPFRETQEERHERKIKRKKEKVVEKKARYESIHRERDQEQQFREMYI